MKDSNYPDLPPEVPRVSMQDALKEPYHVPSPLQTPADVSTKNELKDNMAMAALLDDEDGIKQVMK